MVITSVFMINVLFLIITLWYFKAKIRNIILSSYLSFEILISKLIYTLGKKDFFEGCRKIKNDIPNSYIQLRAAQKKVLRPSNKNC